MCIEACKTSESKSCAFLCVWLQLKVSNLQSNVCVSVFVCSFRLLFPSWRELQLASLYFTHSVTDKSASRFKFEHCKYSKCKVKTGNSFEKCCNHKTKNDQLDQPHSVKWVVFFSLLLQLMWPEFSWKKNTKCHLWIEKVIFFLEKKVCLLKSSFWPLE